MARSFIPRFFMYTSRKIVFLSNFRCVHTHAAKCFLMLSYPITPAIDTFLDIPSIFLHILIQTGLLNKISCIFFHISPAHIHTPHSPPSTSKCYVIEQTCFLHLFFQIFPFHLFCNNHTNKPIILIATCTMIYSSFMMSTRQNISNFRTLLNATQINTVISINNLLHKT